MGAGALGGAGKMERPVIATRLTIATCGSVSATLGSIALCGHFFGYTHLYRWPNDPVGMALNTAVALVLLGFAAVLTGGSERLWRR